MQIVFIKILRLEKEKLPKEKEASWLYEITKNATISFFRNKRQEYSLDEIYYITSEDNEMNNVIDREAYNRIIQKLDKKEQEIVSLKILSNLSFKEISKLLNLPIGTVQWKYYKGIHTLKLLLSNLSMFIIMMMAFVLKKLPTRKKQSNQEEIKEDIIDNSVESRPEETLKKDEINIIGDTTITEDRVEIIETEENARMNIVDIGIFSISSVFLIAAIIFFIIFIKYQQKARKKASK